MKKYRYVGTDTVLVGQTALGRIEQGVFVVQVDNFTHPWSHGWHATVQDAWKEVDPVDWSG